LADRVHNHISAVSGKLKFGIIFTSLILVIEVVGGIMSNSLALLSDAGHVFVDILALVLSWYGVRQSERPSSSEMTFGYHRVGVIVALVNAISIFAIAIFVFYEAYQRVLEPQEVNSPLMLSVAIIGLSVNLFVAFWLRREQRENLNVRSAFWHVLGDALASIGVIIGAIIIMVTDWFIIDPMISGVIGIIILFSAWRILKEGLEVILEATPYGVDVLEMVEAIKQMPGVKAVHDVHVWSISAELHAMSGHVLIDDVPVSQAAQIRQGIQDMLRKQFDIEHTAIQMECHECGCDDLFCKLTFEPDSEETAKEHPR